MLRGCIAASLIVALLAVIDEVNGLGKVEELDFEDQIWCELVMNGIGGCIRERLGAVAPALQPSDLLSGGRTPR